MSSPARRPDARDVAASLAAILARLDAKLDLVLAELRGLRRDRDRPRPDRARVLATIAIAVGDRAFNAAEVLEHGTVDADLRAVLEAARITSPRSLGRYLQRIADRPIHGVRVWRIGEDREGIVWRVSVEAS